MIIKADFQKTTGTIKPMHAVGQPPMMTLDDRMMHYLTEAGIPYARLHDTQGLLGADLFVDIPNIFRDFDADVDDPDSYDFAFTDAFLAKMVEHDVQPFFRLGVTIENYAAVKAYRLQPPKDFQKWAEICEHIILHYNRGWHNGFTYNIRYWEIWNEPEVSYLKDTQSLMWHGTPQQFYRFYATAARHLKKCFGDTIAVGGYASCGFYDFQTVDPKCQGFPDDPTTTSQAFIKFAHEFLAHVRKYEAPLDFFSWHSYATVQDTVAMAGYVRKLLACHGFQDVPDILDEWNNCVSIPKRHTGEPAALALGMMLAMQKTATSMLNYYDARIGPSVYGGLFNPGSWTPYLTYYAFLSFNELYKLRNEIHTQSDDPDIQVGAATDGEQKVLLIANMKQEETPASLDLRGVDPHQADIFLINERFPYAKSETKITDGAITLPPHTCMELRFP